MTRARRAGRAAALACVLAAALLAGGCASCGAPGAEAAEAADAAAPAAAPAPASAAAAGVRIEIDAPDNLRTLLERHLDLVRLGRIAREEVDDSEWSRLIDAAPLQVRELLQTEGHFQPVVTMEREARRGDGEPELVRLIVQPGERARVARVTLEVEGPLERAAAAGDGYAAATLAQLRAAWGLPPGAPFRNGDWSDAKAATLARLRAAGFVTATWSGTAADVDVAKNEVRLFLVADSGPLFRLGSLEVEGLVAQDLQTVLNLLAAPRGSPVTETLVLDFQERLQKTGLFEGVGVTLDPDPAQAGDARVTVRLREAPLQVYTVGVGVSANIGPRASVEHVWRRVLGWPVTAVNEVEWGAKRQAWDGELSTHPDDRLYRNLLGVAIERLESSSDAVLSQRLRLGRTQDTGRIERLYFVEAERSSRRPFGGTRSDAFAISYNYHGVWRQLDSVVLPTEGFSFAGQAGVGRSHGTDAASGYFTRAYGRLTGYLPLGRTWYGQARVELGQVFLRSNMVVPESQKWRAGGDESVRGYGYRSLGPLVNGVVGGGTALATASVEVARPILASMPSLWGAVFVDAGNAADSFRALEPVWGAGIGVRWRSPVGPLRLDWAYGRELRKTRLHFSVGIAF
ncbi:MAG: BamA/TamA family outer membrane protein [Rubrivivax sp.]|nr:BamA/TamA family outer membrane protein [Rubrivivax sp.]